MMVVGCIYILFRGILQVSYVLLSLSRAFGENMLNWARESINLTTTSPNRCRTLAFLEHYI